MNNTKHCNTCNRDLPIESFSKKGSRRQSKCKECHSLYLKEHYKLNRDYYAQKARESAKRKRLAFKKFKESLACSICGETHWACLEFHHIIGDKESAISRLMSDCASEQRMLDEIAKCTVLCANCHRKLHHP